MCPRPEGPVGYDEGKALQKYHGPGRNDHGQSEGLRSATVDRTRQQVGSARGCGSRLADCELGWGEGGSVRARAAARAARKACGGCFIRGMHPLTTGTSLCFHACVIQGPPRKVGFPETRAKDVCVVTGVVKDGSLGWSSGTSMADGCVGGSPYTADAVYRFSHDWRSGKRAP
jgi:hypothetical protein